MGEDTLFRASPPHQRVAKAGSDRLTLLALAFALGIAIGKYAPETDAWMWILLSASLALAAMRQRMRRWIPPAHLVAAAMIPFGAAWYIVTNNHVPGNDLATMLGTESQMVRVTGVAEAAPSVHRAVRGSLAEYAYRTPMTYFPARVDGLVLETGEIRPVQGKLLISVGEMLPPFRAGDRFEAAGHFNPFEEPRNLGEMNRKDLAKGLGQAGSLYLPRRDLLQVTPADRTSLYEQFLGWREGVQRRADAYLLRDLPLAETTDRDVLLKALLLGQREPDLHNLNQAFARLGISHFLAISGLHVTIFVGFILLALRLLQGERTWHSWLVIAVVLGYLVLIDVRLPVLRACIMTIAACLGFGLHRRLHPAGLVALSGIALLLWRPDQFFMPGFQLSFAVVIGLIHLSPLLRERIFRRPTTEASSLLEITVDWLKTAIAVSITAWLVATPLLVFHFGMISPLGILLAVVGVPVVALLLALGYAKIVLALLLPSGAMILGVALSLTAEVAITVIQTLDTLPLTVMHVPFHNNWQDAAWTLAALVFVWIMIARRYWLPRWSGPIGTALLTLWLMWPVLMPPSYALRIDMISVGHGACFVIRSDGETLVFDAGSNTQADAADRWIIPAIRRLNVRSIDTIVISHPHFDHYASVLELAEDFNPDNVLVTHQFIEYGREVPDSPVAHVADVLTNLHRIVPRPVYEGHTQTLGAAKLTWLHPPKNLAEFSRDNEHSMVIRIDVAGRTVLLTGDVERAGTAGVLTKYPNLRADVVEMPHHGAWHELSTELMRQTKPELILQSSSRAQWTRDRWEDLLTQLEAQRFVTHRDGAAWVEIGHDGTITSGTLRE